MPHGSCPPLADAWPRASMRRPSNIPFTRARHALIGAFALGAMTFAAPAAQAAPAEPAVIEAADKVAAPSAFNRFIADAEDASTGTTRVIVGLKLRFDPEETTTKSGMSTLSARLNGARAGVNRVLAGTKHKVVREYSALPYVALEVSPEGLEALQTSGEVASIHEDQTFTPQLSESTQVVESAAPVSRGINGSGRVVAVLDTGV